MTALFENIIFGPIKSRRLGLSLGVNLLPEHAKICNFDCLYCECGSNAKREGDVAQRRFAVRAEVRTALRAKLQEMIALGELPDVITFAGNGEPTLHPHFEQIIDDTIALRDELLPDAKISVLSNATMLGSEGVVRALKRIDNNILKLDSAIDATAAKINRATGGYHVEDVISHMVAFRGSCIVQIMILRGDGVDNTTEVEVAAMEVALRRIKPQQVMLYSISRDTAYEGVQAVPKSELEVIAERFRALQIAVSVS